MAETFQQRSRVSGIQVFGANTDIDGFLSDGFSGEGHVALEIPAMAATCAWGTWAGLPLMRSRRGTPTTIRSSDPSSAASVVTRSRTASSGFRVSGAWRMTMSGRASVFDSSLIAIPTRRSP